MTPSVARVPYGGTSALEAYQGARIAQTWAEESATLGYATEERNYRDQTYIGEGEARLQLVPFLRKWSADALQQERDWEALCAAEARSLPDHCVGADVLEACKAETDPLAAAIALGEALEQAQALTAALSLVRADAMRQMIASGMSQSDIGRALCLSRQAVSKALRER